MPNIKAVFLVTFLPGTYFGCTHPFGPNKYRLQWIVCVNLHANLATAVDIVAKRSLRSFARFSSERVVRAGRVAAAESWDIRRMPRLSMWDIIMRLSDTHSSRTLGPLHLDRRRCVLNE